MLAGDGRPRDRVPGGSPGPRRRGRPRARRGRRAAGPAPPGRTRGRGSTRRRGRILERPRVVIRFAIRDAARNPGRHVFGLRRHGVVQNDRCARMVARRGRRPAVRQVCGAARVLVHRRPLTKRAGGPAVRDGPRDVCRGRPSSLRRPVLLARSPRVICHGRRACRVPSRGPIGTGERRSATAAGSLPTRRGCRRARPSGPPGPLTCRSARSPGGRAGTHGDCDHDPWSVYRPIE